MIYVVIDANIFISLLHERNEHEYKLSDKRYGNILSNEIEDNQDVYDNMLPKSLIALSTLCKNNIVKLLVPEVTLLELEKANNKFKEDCSFEFKKLKEVINSHEMWNEINYIKKDLTTIIDSNEKVNIKNWETSYATLIKFLRDECNTEIALNPGIICELYRKKILGTIEDRQGNDFLLLSSVYDYMKDKYSHDTKLILVTNDKKDFFKKERISGFYQLKEQLKDSSINVLGLTNLISLYKNINANVDLSKEYKDINTKIVLI